MASERSVKERKKEKKMDRFRSRSKNFLQDPKSPPFLDAQVASIMQNSSLNGRSNREGGNEGGSEFSALLSRETAKTLTLKVSWQLLPPNNWLIASPRSGRECEWAEWVREKKICLPTRYSHGCPKCAAICRSPGRPPDTVYLSPIRCTSANKREEGGKKKVGERDSNRVETL